MDAAHNTPPPITEGAKILLVDDDRAILEGVADLLMIYGYEVRTAANGQLALKAMQDDVPDLVISDIMMPTMDGYDFYRAVRSNPAWVPVPFIFLTARGQQADIRRGQSVGADAYLTKPFEPQDLLVAIESRLRRVRELQSHVSADMDRMKQQLITIFSHELRTPLTYIYGYVNLLREQYGTLDPEEANEMLDGVQRGAERLVRLVEDLMLMVRIDAGVVEMEIALQQSLYPLGNLIHEVIDLNEAAAAERGITLSSKVPTDAAHCCVTLYIQDVLNRLVDNAIKFSRKGEGGVSITADVDNGNIVISVIDSGIGIHPTHQQTIFESFRQINRETMEQQGIGLGLTIVRSLIDLHGGSVRVESTPGEGSTFVVTLPRSNAVYSHEGSCLPAVN